MKNVAAAYILSTLLLKIIALDNETKYSRAEKQLSVFNVVKFPNDPCGAANGYNGTCFTNTECISRGGSSSGACASSFGVCCVFTLSCGGTSSDNNTYAIISSYNVNSDADPCTYTFCKVNSDVCKLRIDYTAMVLAAPTGESSTPVYTDGGKVGRCETDTLTVSNPSGSTPPIICGYNTGQHMWVPASDQCNQISMDIDTANTGTTRKWEIKVTQHECDSLAAPDIDCLQYLYSESGTIATFNWDTSITTVGSTQVHLSSQYYDICIRRASGKCGVCFDPHISDATIATTAASFGVGASGHAGPVQKAAVGSQCKGNTVIHATATNQVGLGDYVEVQALHGPPFASSTISGVQKVCGTYWGAVTDAVAQATACSYATPFRLSVHFDNLEAIYAPPIPATDLDHTESAGISGNSGKGTTGFWLNYWQVAC